MPRCRGRRTPTCGAARRGPTSASRAAGPRGGPRGGGVGHGVGEGAAADREAEMGQLPLGKRSVSPALIERAAAMEVLYRSIGRLNPSRPKDFLAPIPGYRGSSADRLAQADFPIMFLVGDHDAGRRIALE